MMTTARVGFRTRNGKPRNRTVTTPLTAKPSGGLIVLSGGRRSKTHAMEGPVVRRLLLLPALIAIVGLSFGHADGKDKTTCGDYGTSVHFHATPSEAAKQAL